jgi:hypothetical protein
VAFAHCTLEGADPKAAVDQLIDDLRLLESGLARLRAREISLSRETEAEYQELVRCREPVVQHVIDSLASELALTESKASALRARLRGFSLCSNGQTPQKLSGYARGLLINPPVNVAGPQMNSPQQREADREREIFRSWKKSLESDAQAQLVL